MRSPGINGEGELRGQPANSGSPGKMAVKTECVCVLLCYFVISFSYATFHSHAAFHFSHLQNKPFDAASPLAVRKGTRDTCMYSRILIHSQVSPR